MRLSKNIRGSNIYLGDSTDKHSCSSSMIYGYYRHQILDEKWYHDQITQDNKDELEEYLYYEGQLQKHISRCIALDCPCHTIESTFSSSSLKSKKTSNMATEKDTQVDAMSQKTKISKENLSKKSFNTLMIPKSYSALSENQHSAYTNIKSQGSNSSETKDEICPVHLEDAERDKIKFIKRMANFKAFSEPKPERNPITSSDNDKNLLINGQKNTENLNKRNPKELRKLQLYMLNQKFIFKNECQAILQIKQMFYLFENIKKFRKSLLFSYKKSNSLMQKFDLYQLLKLFEYTILYFYTTNENIKDKKICFELDD